MEVIEPTPAERDSTMGAESSGYPDLAPTGDASVDEVLQSLASVPTADDDATRHALYDRLHDELLAELNSEQG